MLDIDPFVIFFIQNKEIRSDFDEWHLDLDRKERLVSYALKKNFKVINYIKNPTIKQCKEVLDYDVSLFDKIQNPSNIIKVYHTLLLEKKK